MSITGAMSCCQAPRLPVLTWRSPEFVSSASSTTAFPQDFMPPKFSKQLIVNGRARRTRKIPAFRSAVRASAASDVADKKVDLKKLDGINVYTPEGTRVPLLSLWENRPAVIAFTRHFGCMLCRKRMVTLESRKAEMDAAGVALITITPGNPEQARKFLSDYEFSGEVYCDPNQETHAALEFVKGLATTFNPTSLSLSQKATDEGYKVDWSLFFKYGETMRRGAWQQGGILVAGPGTQTVKYIYKDKYSGDDAPMEEVLSACCA